MNSPSQFSQSLVGTKPYIVGSAGMLGRAWRQWLDAHNIEYACGDLGDIDITDPASVESVIDESHRVVVNCAAYTNVDAAEEDEDRALVINSGGVENLARHCRQINAKLVHYSTDYVFNGCSDTPYRPDEPRDPLGAYGRTKAAGEAALENSGADYLLIRISWLYAPWGKNFVRTMAKLTSEKPALRVVHDQVGRPTSAESLVEATANLLAHGAAGPWHVTDGGQCSWYEFTQAIAELCGASCDITPCTTEEFPRPAPRPAYSVLDLEKTEQMIGPRPDWRVNLADVLNRLESE
ncbi:dTDP-4-dehydrorhamnose reductase [Planctomycetales bacterium ZRK34]|nr:dTDP-4-dehydrorhamnose reductase [Planctomycetales bacterium ZRK34]